MAVDGAWASIQDVSDYTGATVTQAKINIAQGMIEGLIKRVWRESDSDTSAYYWLSRAVAWQAKYVDEHPDLIDSPRVQSLSQDGFAVSYGSVSNSTEPSNRSYSPQAIQMLNNLFRGANTTIRMNSAFQRSGRRRRSSIWRRTW